MDDFNTALSNAPTTTFETIMNKTKEYARNQGRGANARANWLLDVVRGAAEGALDTVKRNAKGEEDKKAGKDHATLLYEAYVAECSKVNVHNAKTVISKSSNLRKAIEMGMRNDIDAIAVMNIAIVEHKALSEDESVKLQPAFEAFNHVVRAQQANDMELSRDEIRDAMIKGESAEIDASGYLRRAMKQVEKAYELDKSPKVVEALDAVNAALGWVAAEKERADLLKQLMEIQRELGIDLVVQAAE
jgi:hypothetical protein